MRRDSTTRVSPMIVFLILEWQFWPCYRRASRPVVVHRIHWNSKQLTTSCNAGRTHSSSRRHGPKIHWQLAVVEWLLKKYRVPVASGIVMVTVMFTGLSPFAGIFIYNKLLKYNMPVRVLAMSVAVITTRHVYQKRHCHDLGIDARAPLLEVRVRENSANNFEIASFY